jgi:cysteine desulfurase
LALKDKGFQVEILPVNERGMVEENTLKNAIGSDVGLVCVMTVNNETGVVQPVQALSKIAKEYGALFFTDAVQAAPYLPLKVNDLGTDMLSISAHKFYGPKGAGVLYIKKGIKIERLIAGGQQQRGMRAGTVNTPSVVGLALALEKAVNEREENNEKITSVKKAFKDALLCAVDKVTENGGGEKIPSVWNVKIEGVDNAAFLRDMDLHGIALSAGSACESSSLTPSRTLTAMGLEEQEVKSSVRFSFGKDNTVKEALAAAKIAAEIIKKLRRF